MTEEKEVYQRPKEFYPSMTVHQALLLHDEAGLVLASFHLGGCAHCGINEIETLEQICMGYGVPIDELLQALNNLLEEEDGE